MNKKIKKVSIKQFRGWKNKLENNPRSGDNFRQLVERIGVPSKDVKDFKYWLIKERNKK